ncbi:MAG: ABC transporter permease [Cryobacterium sp.]
MTSNRRGPAPTTLIDLRTNDGEVGKSQAALVFCRFVDHKIALVSIVVVAFIAVLSSSAAGLGPIPGWWPLTYSQLNPVVDGGAPTMSMVPRWLGGDGVRLGDHPFGQDRIGKDYFAMTMRGIQNSLTIMFIVGLLATVIGTVIGAVAGYYRGIIDAILMRFTDLIIIIPVIVIGALVGAIAGQFGGAVDGPVILAILLGLFTWTTLARLVRGEFFTLREREYVEAARVAGASDLRIIFKHVLPNAIGVVIVAATLLMASAILLEVALGFLGLGVQPPDVSLGRLISDNQSAFATRPWLFWWPGLFIIVLALCVNFIGDGLRDAFDPRQRRFRPRKTTTPVA